MHAYVHIHWDEYNLKESKCKQLLQHFPLRLIFSKAGFEPSKWSQFIHFSTGFFLILSLLCPLTWLSWSRRAATVKGYRNRSFILDTWNLSDKKKTHRSTEQIKSICHERWITWICGALMDDYTFSFAFYTQIFVNNNKKTGLKSDNFPNGLLGMSWEDYAAVGFSLPSQWI